ncbi:MAG: acyl-CoA dehydrogenase family protein [Gammaproteobacteria bacterium]|nr:acyl-CoA dehydrogenase family protein [Gammaproteobacteria bacterium]
MNSSSPLLQQAQSLRPLLIEAGADIEQSRRLSAEVREALAAMGAFHLQLGREYGGVAADPQTYLDVIEELSRGDASAGWCAMVASESSACLNAWLAPEVIRDMLGKPPLAAVSLTAVGKGRAVVEGDGYRVSGRWRFTSGCRHAEWLGALCVVHDGDAPRVNANGAAELRLLFVPVAAANLIDTWHTSGLKGTASDDFELHEVTVPAAHGFGLRDAPRDDSPAWRIPLGLRLAMSKAAAVCGMARGAMDAVVPLLERTPFAGARPAREEARVQYGLAEAQGAIEAGRAYLRQEVARCWQQVCAGSPLALADIARTRLAIVTAARSALTAVNTLQDLGGTAGVFTPRFDRAVRDLQVARHHLQLQAHVMEDIGRVMLGQAPQNPLF